MKLDSKIETNQQLAAFPCVTCRASCFIGCSNSCTGCSGSCAGPCTGCYLLDTR